MVSSSYAFEAALGLGWVLGLERARRALTHRLTEQAHLLVHGRIEALVDLDVSRPAFLVGRRVEVPVAMRVQDQSGDKGAVVAERLAVNVDAQRLVAVINVSHADFRGSLLRFG